MLEMILRNQSFLLVATPRLFQKIGTLFYTFKRLTDRGKKYKLIAIIKTENETGSYKFFINKYKLGTLIELFGRMKHCNNYRCMLDFKTIETLYHSGRIDEIEGFDLSFIDEENDKNLNFSKICCFSDKSVSYHCKTRIKKAKDLVDEIKNLTIEDWILFNKWVKTKEPNNDDNPNFFTLDSIGKIARELDICPYILKDLIANKVDYILITHKNFVSYLKSVISKSHIQLKDYIPIIDEFDSLIDQIMKHFTLKIDPILTLDDLHQTYSKIMNHLDREIYEVIFPQRFQDEIFSFSEFFVF